MPEPTKPTPKEVAPKEAADIIRTAANVRIAEQATRAVLGVAAMSFLAFLVSQGLGPMEASGGMILTLFVLSLL